MLSIYHKNFKVRFMFLIWIIYFLKIEDLITHKCFVCAIMNHEFTLKNFVSQEIYTVCNYSEIYWDILLQKKEEDMFVCLVPKCPFSFSQTWLSCISSDWKQMTWKILREWGKKRQKWNILTIKKGCYTACIWKRMSSSAVSDSETIHSLSQNQTATEEG